MLILLSIPLLRVYNQNTVGENGDFQPLYIRENISQTVSNAATVTINNQWEIA